MSSIIGALKIENEILVAIDYDRPIWQNVKNNDLRNVPNLDHFAVDGVLIALSEKRLNSLGIDIRPTDFQKPDLKLTEYRNNIYSNKDLIIEYFDLEQNVNEITKDLQNFSCKIINTPISEAELKKILES